MTSFTRRNLGLAAGMATAVALTAGAMIAFSANATPITGEAAPGFTNAVTATGDTISLSDFAGQTVVMEWTNHDCPFVKKHYAEPVTNMQTLQSEATAGGTVWIQVISSAPGKQGYLEAEAALAKNTERGAAPTYTILDPSGDIGRAYDAKTTPHMYVIEGDGELAYEGAIDSIRSARVSDIGKATNYVTAALTAVTAGATPDVTSSKPYGCSVKY
ncbi:MAG: redoxin domain-containing protein [Hyphomonadaceae bacterium]|nr:redoxin domain-containing protein [Hyphomonadaceae bacterium]